MTKKAPTDMTAKEKFIREMIVFLCSDDVKFYRRSDRVYVDMRAFKTTGLMALEGSDFLSFVLRLAKTTENALLRSADFELIIDHVRHTATRKAVPLSIDARAAYRDGKLYVNTGWEDEKVLEVAEDGAWSAVPAADPIFEPLPLKMRMPVPVAGEAKSFPEILKSGIADFGDMHCLLAVTCATMLLPADFVHPFMVFTGSQARGKSTTMKLLVQLIDPYESSELMTVGEDMRDIIALVRGRHSVALDNVSKLPFDEDLLSKMYSGGVFSARKMTTNSDISEVELPRLRVLMNGIGTAFSRSDLLSRCIFIEHPVLTTKNEGGNEVFSSLSRVEKRWQALLPSALGSLLASIGAGLKLFHERGGVGDKGSEARFVEYAIMGECIAEVMGFPAGLFTEQVKKAAQSQKDAAIDADDCAQLVIAWLEGETGDVQMAGWDEKPKASVGATERIIAPSELYKEIRAIAASRGYATYSIKWLASVKAMTQTITRSTKNIENAGWTIRKYAGGEHKRKLKFTKEVEQKQELL